jgi:hypothetical protein
MPPKRSTAKKVKVNANANATANANAGEQLNANVSVGVAANVGVAAGSNSNTTQSNSNNSLGLTERTTARKTPSRRPPPVAVAATTSANLPPPPPPGAGAVMLPVRPVMVSTAAGPNAMPRPTFAAMATQTNLQAPPRTVAAPAPLPLLPERAGSSIRAGCSTALDYASTQIGVLGNKISTFADAQIPMGLAANGNVRYRPDSLVLRVSKNERGDFPPALVSTARKCIVASTVSANQIQEVVRAVQEYLAVYTRAGSYSDIVILDAARGVFEELLLYLVFLYDKLILRMQIKNYYKSLPSYMKTSSVNSQESALELNANVPQVARNVINLFRNLFTAPLQARIFTNNIINILQKGKIADTLNQIVRMYPELAERYFLAPGRSAGALASTIPMIRGTELAETEEEYEAALGPATHAVDIILANRLGLGADACIPSGTEVSRGNLLSRTGKGSAVTGEASETILPKRTVLPEIRSALDRLVGDVAKKNTGAKKANMSTMTNTVAAAAAVPTPEVAAIVETVNEEIQEAVEQIAVVAPEGETEGTNATQNTLGNANANAEGGARRRRRHHTRRRKVHRKRSTYRRR